MKKYIIALIFIVLLFNGFSNLREITDLAIVRAIGLDLDEDGNYRASVIVLDTSKEEENQGIIYEASGASVQEAVRNIVDKSPKKLYLAHMETLIVSEEIAREKLRSTLDFFIRDNEGSNNFFLMVAKECEAKEIIEVASDEEISMKEILLSSVKYKGDVNIETLNDKIKDILKPGKDICVNVCGVEDEKIIMKDMAYFSGWNMQGYLNDEESTSYNILENNVENVIIAVGNEKDLIVTEIVDSKSKLSYKDGKIKIVVNMSLNVSETGENINLETEEEINKATNAVKEEIKSRLDNLIYKCQNEYKVDIIGFGNLLYRKKVSDTDKIDVETEVKVKISNQGGVMRK